MRNSFELASMITGPLIPESLACQYLIMTDINTDTVRTAFHYQAYLDDPSISLANNYRLLREGPDAARLVLDNKGQFEALLWEQVNKFPNFKKFFSHLIAGRLKQDRLLSSVLLGKAFNDLLIIENKLDSLRSVHGISSLIDEYQPAKRRNKGERTDAAARDLLAELTSVYFMLELGFKRIKKVYVEDNMPHIDFLATKHCRKCAIEVTRKKDNPGWESLALGNLSDCISVTNISKMREILLMIMGTKGDQFQKCLEENTLSGSAIRILGIKFSDFNFQECIDQASSIASDLLVNEVSKFIDIIWLMPDVDVSNSRLIDPHGKLTIRWKRPGMRRDLEA